jgi:hypothetical protein
MHFRADICIAYVMPNGEVALCVGGYEQVHIKYVFVIAYLHHREVSTTIRRFNSRCAYTI